MKHCRNPGCRGGTALEYLALLAVAVAPAFFLLLYLYFRDRHEREPLGLVVRTFAAGALATLPVVAANLWIVQPAAAALGVSGPWVKPWDAFVSASLVEETAKFLVVWLVAFRNPNLNEPFDGIVYAAAASLGFATLENILYVLSSDLNTGAFRAILAVPGHTVFGITMGYHLGFVKFVPPGWARTRLWLLALLGPVAMHGVYDLLAFHLEYQVALALLFPVLAFFWVRAVRVMDRSQAQSPFAPAGARAPAFAGPCSGCGTPLVRGANFCHQCGLPAPGHQAAGGPAG